MKTTLRNLSDRRFSGLVATAIVTAGVLVFGQTLFNEFVRWDDRGVIAGNPVLAPPQWAGMWVRPTLGLYTPLSYTLLGVLTSLSARFSGSLHPIWFHAGNLLLHLIAAFFCWRLLIRLTCHRLAGVAGTAVFLLHPLAVEPVAWAASLNTVLAGALGLIALSLAADSLAEDRQSSRLGVFAFASAVFVLALLAKPSVCAAPLALLAIDRLYLRVPRRLALQRAAAWAVLSIPFLIVGRFAQPPSGAGVVPIGRRVAVVLDSIGFYVWHWLVPVQIGIDYGRAPDQLVLSATSIIYGLAAITVIAVGLISIRRWPQISAALLVALAGAAPVLGAVPFSFQFYSTVADRYAYLSTIGVAMLIATLVRSAASQRSAAMSVAVGSVALGALSFVQIQTWHDTFSLMRQALRVNPDSVAAHEVLAFEFSEASMNPKLAPAERDRLASQAFSLYDRVLQIRPPSLYSNGKADYLARTHFNLGNLFFKTGRPAEAAAQYVLAEAALGDDSRLQNNWGIVCWQLHEPGEAIEHFDRALRADPLLAETYANKAVVLMRTGQKEQAVALCRRALQLDAKQPQAIRLLDEAMGSRP